MTSPKVNLLGLDHAGLKTFFLKMGEKPYRAQQLLKWIHFYGVTDFNLMTDMGKSLRQKLSDSACLDTPKLLYEHAAKDGTHKWLLQLYDGNAIETVFIPEKKRGTLCISSQVGCVLNCDFCSTGKQGFSRNLSAAEIISQLWLAVRKLSQSNGQHDHTVTNVVMMGMGEPLLNFDQLIPALRIMLDDHAYGLSKRRVTVSTAGVIPKMYDLRKETDVALAVSLHAPNDALRNQLVPINKKYPLAALKTACKDYFKNEPRRSITMEYVMLAGINDSIQHAKELIALMSGLKVKINLIPFNPFPNTNYQRSSSNVINVFRAYLQQAGLNVTIRKTRGDDINAACGQLVGQVKDRTNRQKKAIGERG